MITAAQLRAARGLLDWSRGDLSKASKVSQETIKNIEHGIFRPQETTEQALIRAFATHGVEFSGSEGVLLRRDSVIRYEGPDGLKRFLDDVYEAAQQPYSASGGNKPLYTTCVGDEIFPKLLGDYLATHVRRMNAIKNLRMHLLLTQKPTTVLDEEKETSYRTYRITSKRNTANASFYVYGDKLAIINLEETAPQVLVISSPLAARAYREQFETLWEVSAPLGN
jgi:DNA-binding XRE family transcriptional regulator